MRGADREVPVLIAGGGPVGLATAICLARQGVRSLLVERHPGTTRHPKASVVNVRTMELFRTWGLDQAVRDGGVPVERLRYVVWATAITGLEIGRLDLSTFATNVETESPVQTAICAQDVVEPALLARARSHPETEIRFDTALEGFTQHEDGVAATVASVTSGARTIVRARYLVAADGHASGVRRQLGVTMAGPEPLGDMINIHFGADLTTYTDRWPGPLYWIVNPDVVGVVIALNGRDRWLLNVPYDCPAETVDDYSPERCRALVRRAVGVPDLTIEIRGVTAWTMRREIATRYRDGRVFLAGDAAHLFPPTGGFGMNCGIQDAHNLAWKLAAVLQDVAGDALLDTYEAERRPVAQLYTDQSARNAQKVMAGMRPVPVVEDPGPDGAAFRAMLAAGIPGQREHFEAAGQALGFAYESAAIVADGTPAPAVENPIRDYVPVARPGHRAPHVTVRVNGTSCSTLDLFGDRFVLLTTPAGTAWGDAGRALAGASGVALDVHAIAEGPEHWPGAYGIAPDGAVLVRPDGHVAWRRPHLDVIPRVALAAALEQILANDRRAAPGRGPIGARA